MAQKGVLVLVGIGGLAALALLRSDSAAPSAPGPSSPRPTSPPDDEEANQRNVTALARMLNSETRGAAQIVIAWMAKETARRRKEGIFQLLTGKSGQYGHQHDHGEIRYASTFEPATAESLARARAILTGQLLPSAKIRSMGPGAWVEKGVGGWDAKKLLSKQTHPDGAKDYGGIWARVAQTNWYLYNAKAPIVLFSDGQADKVLATVPAVPATDDRRAVA